jgi:hypothetical protein
MTKRVSQSRAKSKPTSPGKPPAGSSADADQAIAKLERKIAVPAAGIGIVPPAIGIVPPAADVDDSRTRQTAGPECPNCPGKVCVAQSTKTLFTWYVCPDNCGFRVKIPRPDLRQHLDRQRAQEPAVKRP